MSLTIRLPRPAASGRFGTVSAVRRPDPPASSSPAPSPSSPFARPLSAVHRPRRFDPARFWLDADIIVTLAIPGRDITVTISPDVFVSQRRFAIHVLRQVGWPLPLVSRATWSQTVAELLRRGRE